MPYRRKIALVLMSLALAAGGAATLILYLGARSYLVAEIESKAMSIAATAATLVDADLQRKLAEGEAPPDAGLALRRQLAAVRDTNRRKDVHAYFVYTAVRTAAGRMRAVVDDDTGATAGSRRDLAENDRIPPGTIGVEELKADEFGTWISGYAPVRDSAGRAVGTLVVDLAANDLLSRLRLLFWSGAGAVGAAFVLAALVSFPVARRVTGPLEATVKVVDRIAAGDLEARSNVRTGDEIERLGQALNAMIPRLRDYLRLRQSVQVAQEVQRNLLPAAWPRVASFEIAARSVYCDEIGGDYYDVIDLSSASEARLGIVVADVAGHGIPAALLMATTRAILRARAVPGASLGSVVAEANESILRDQFSNRFVTLFAMIVDTRDLRLRWVSAGHEPAILYDPATDTFEELAGEDIPLGVRSWTYRERAREGWRRGQVILIGTDGIWETRDPAGRRFGRDALRALVRAHAHRPPADILAEVLAALASFRGTRVQEDDVTLVVLRA